MESSDWLDMINTHVKWKQRLEAYIAGVRTETFDGATVASDKTCILGKWIYSNAKVYKNIEVFEKVKGLHADLHTYASMIITLTNDQEISSAKQLLDGDFSEISHHFKRDIVLLSKRVS